jgi:hypothetical protein
MSRNTAVQNLLLSSALLITLVIRWNSRVVSLVLNFVCFQAKAVSWTSSGVSKTVSASQSCLLQDELQFVCEYGQRSRLHTA